MFSLTYEQIVENSPLRFWIITAVFLLLISLRVALPFAAKWYQFFTAELSRFTGKINRST